MLEVVVQLDLGRHNAGTCKCNAGLTDILNEVEIAYYDASCYFQ